MLKENGNASIAVSRRFQQIQLASSIKIETKPRRPSCEHHNQIVDHASTHHRNPAVHYVQAIPFQRAV
jgi:hypothetical protein